MKKLCTGNRTVSVVVLACLLFGLLGSSVQAQAGAKLGAKLAEALDHRIYGRFDEGIALASSLLGRDNLTPQDSIAAQA